MIHILGIAGTFMAGVAALAKESGIAVSGSDAHVYPPMSTLLESLGIETSDYHHTRPLDHKTGHKTIVIGNALSRGNPSVEYTLNHKLPYTSGPEWLHNKVLKDRTVLAVAGTHGKTTTSSMLAWILQLCLRDQNKTPGFLIGGKPGNFAHSAQLGSGEYFVIEADEYDTAFFDKRSKFIHYQPHITVLNNLEFDHADIFADLAAIQTQFHHLIKTLPENGKLIVNADDDALKAVIDMGCWTPIETFSIEDKNADWFAQALDNRASRFEITRKRSPEHQHQHQSVEINWQGMGQHNMNNALAAVAAATQIKIDFKQACLALETFIFPNKRLQAHQSKLGFKLFEDFAHHPTAIEKTLQTLRSAYPNQRLIAVLELRSNTMKAGVHGDSLAQSLDHADLAFVVDASIKASAQASRQTSGQAQQQTLSSAHCLFTDSKKCYAALKNEVHENDVLVIMSNGHFDGLVKKMITL